MKEKQSYAYAYNSPLLRDFEEPPGIFQTFFGTFQIFPGNFSDKSQELPRETSIPNIIPWQLIHLSSVTLKSHRGLSREFSRYSSVLSRYFPVAFPIYPRNSRGKLGSQISYRGNCVRGGFIRSSIAAISRSAAPQKALASGQPRTWLSHHQ